MPTKEDEEKEPLVSRWSRRKQEARDRALQEAPAKPVDSKPMPELPPVDKLTFESDFSGFMDARVDSAVRRIALKKLFSDPRFNITDGLDDYAEDYAALEDLPAALVAQLQHARSTLGSADPDDSKAPATQVDEERIELPAEQSSGQPPASESQPLADAGPPEDGSGAPTDSDDINKNQRNG